MMFFFDITVRKAILLYSFLYQVFSLFNVCCRWVVFDQLITQIDIKIMYILTWESFSFHNGNQKTCREFQSNYGKCNYPIGYVGYSDGWPTASTHIEQIRRLFCFVETSERENGLYILMYWIVTLMDETFNNKYIRIFICFDFFLNSEK